MVSVGAVLKALEDYNARTTRHLRMQGAELYHMIAMLTRTVATLGSGNEQSVSRLREIEGQIEKTSGIEDVRVLKLRLERVPGRHSHRGQAAKVGDRPRGCQPAGRDSGEPAADRRRRSRSGARSHHRAARARGRRRRSCRMGAEPQAALRRVLYRGPRSFSSTLASGTKSATGY